MGGYRTGVCEKGARARVDWGKRGLRTQDWRWEERSEGNQAIGKGLGWGGHGEVGSVLRMEGGSLRPSYHLSHYSNDNSNRCSDHRPVHRTFSKCVIHDPSQ